MKEVLKELEQIIRRGYDAHRVFDDWIALMFYALMRNDEEYLKIVGRYRNEGEIGKREIDHFKNAFHLLMAEMKNTNDEYLGELYMQWEVSNKYTGQFFTPYHIAKFMSEITEPMEGSIYDPTCGSGVMLIAAAKTMTNDQLDKALFVGQDIDFTCVMMAALNMTFFNLNGYVILGNTLTLEYSAVFQTRRSYIGGDLRELTPEEVERIRPKIEAAKQESKIAQQTLF